MTDDPGATPPPRPRRRRTDWDPNAPTPRVAYERRRAKRPSTKRTPAPEAAATAAAIPPSEVPAPAPEPAPAPVPGTTEVPHVDRPAPDVEPETVPDPRSWLPLLDARSPNAWVCPFLRSVGHDGRLDPPIEGADVTNRCAALDEAVPQSMRQQELVCLTSGHVNCPRYLRGAVAVAEVPPPIVRAGRSISPAVAGSLVVLAFAFLASIGFVASRGGLDLEVASRSPGASASEVAAASPTLEPDPSQSSIATPTVAPTPTEPPTPTPAPTPSPSPTPSPTPEPTPKPTPEPTSDRYALLRKCPDAPRCWIYTVRSGDNIYSIARWFGVPEDSVYRMNPWLEDRGLRAGQQLRLPPPTR